MYFTKTEVRKLARRWLQSIPPDLPVSELTERDWERLTQQFESKFHEKEMRRTPIPMFHR